MLSVTRLYLMQLSEPREGGSAFHRWGTETHNRRDEAYLLLDLKIQSSYFWRTWLISLQKVIGKKRVTGSLGLILLNLSASSQLQPLLAESTRNWPCLSLSFSYFSGRATTFKMLTLLDCWLTGLHSPGPVQEERHSEAVVLSSDNKQFYSHHPATGVPAGSGVKNLLTNKRQEADPWVGKSPWRRKWQPTPGFLPGKSHGQRSLVGCSPWGCKRAGHDLATNTATLNTLNTGMVPRKLYLLIVPKVVLLHD